jgi:hypothetical protein
VKDIRSARDTIVEYDVEDRFVLFLDMILADGHVQSRATMLICFGFTCLFRL